MDVEKTLMDTPGVQHVTCFVGFSLLSFVRTSYNSTFFVTFKPWGERTTRAEQFHSLKAHLNQQLSKLPTAVAFGFSPPAIPGVGYLRAPPRSLSLEVCGPHRMTATAQASGA